MGTKEKIRKALERLDYYGAPPDDSPIYVDSRADGTSYELLDGEEGPQLTLADLRLLVAEE